MAPSWLCAGPREQLAPPPRRSAIRAGARQARRRRVELRRDAVAHLPLGGLPGAVATEHLASVSNPEFYRRQAQRLSMFGIPRLVTCFEHDESELRIPQSLLREAASLLTDAGFRVEVRTDTASTSPIVIIARTMVGSCEVPAAGARRPTVIPARPVSGYSRRDDGRMERITIDPEICGGRPTIRGMRIRVQDVLELLAAGAPESEIPSDHPDLEADDLRASLAYAAREIAHPVLIAS